MANIFLNHEMLGDSQFVRFIAQTKRIKPEKNADGCNYFGMCVSGQGIRKLTRAVRYATLQKKIVIFIGTNDIRRGTAIKEFKNILHELIGLLKGKEVVLLTIPPLPFYSMNSHQFILWEGYNRSIRKVKGCKILDIVPLFFSNGTIFVNFFEKYYYGKKKMDLIHLNSSGLKRLEIFLNLNLGPNI